MRGGRFSSINNLLSTRNIYALFHFCTCNRNGSCPSFSDFIFLFLFFLFLRVVLVKEVEGTLFLGGKAGKKGGKN